MSKDLDVNKLMDNVKALSVENENLLSEKSIRLRLKNWSLRLQIVREAVRSSMRINVR